MERTLIIFKPDAVQRGIVGEVLARFEKAGLKIIGAKMVQPGNDHFFAHYETIGKLATRRGQKTMDVALGLMSQGPVIAMVLEGIEAVGLVRKMVGATEPKSALPGTIRGDYAHMSYGYADAAEVGIPNIVHASGDENDAQQEVAHWFSESELFSYDTVHEKFTQTKKKSV